MFIFALVLADVVALRRGRAWCGVGIGLATALKLTPGLFLVFLVLIGRRRAAVVAAGTALGATLLGFAVDAGASWEYWTSTLWDTSRVGRLVNPWNQSILGLLAHVSDPAQPDRLLWALLAAGVAVLGLWRAVRVYRRGDDLDRRHARGVDRLPGEPDLVGAPPVLGRPGGGPARGRGSRDPGAGQRSRAGRATARARSPSGPACSPSPSPSRSSCRPTGPSCPPPGCRPRYPPTSSGGASTPASCWRCWCCSRRGISGRRRTAAPSGARRPARPRPGGWSPR